MSAAHDRPVVVDVTRLLSRIHRDAPTGIDRVDLAYARNYLTGNQPGVVWTRWGSKLMPPAVVADLLDTLEERWGSSGTQTRQAGASELSQADPAYQRVADWLNGPATTPPPAPATETAAGHRRGRTARTRVTNLLRSRRWQPASDAPADAAYVHTSHLGLDLAERLSWLDQRPDVRPVFFIQDLIPVEFPEYMRSAETARHRQRLVHLAQRAAGALTSSHDVAERLTAYLNTHGLRTVPMCTAPIGVEGAFEKGAEPLVAARPYFVMIGTIEARKNHALMLQVWRALARRLGERTPALVVIGRRGWEAEAAIDLLDRCEVIAPHVIEATGLSTSALAAVLSGARALLMPSFAEGYGIPIVEALSVATPVVASDIAVHREVAGPFATYVDPTDGPGWAGEIERLSEPPTDRALLQSFALPRWSDHFAVADPFLRSR